MSEYGNETPQLVSPANIHWRKSAASGSHAANCIEISFVRDSTLIRDSKHPAGHHLVLSLSTWSAFLDFSQSAH